MSIISSLRNTITTTLDTATDLVGAAQESISMATTYVHHRAVAQQVVDKDTVILDTTIKLNAIKAELKDNEELQALFDKTAELFD